MPLRGVSMPRPFIVSLKTSRSSPRSIASRFTPMTLTPYLSSTPALFSSIAMLRPVCPPRLGSSASGLSFSIIWESLSTFRGSMYVASAMTGSVMIVAGLELTSTIL